MPFDFPSSPTEGQIFNAPSGPSYVFNAPVWKQLVPPQIVATAEARNRIVNPAMQISQENGDTLSSTNGFFPADQWQFTSPIATTGTGREAPPNFSPNGGRRITTNIATGKPSLAATDLWYFTQRVEGVRLADFQWGTAAAKPAVLRFWANSTVAGTYSVNIRNSAVDRSFLASFTLAASTWKEVIIPVPADTTGTWLKDTGVGMHLAICWAVGTTYQGAAGWQAGNFLGVTGMTNGAATLSSFYLADVGLYLDPQNTGVATGMADARRGGRTAGVPAVLLKAGRFSLHVGHDTPQIRPAMCKPIPPSNYAD